MITTKRGKEGKTKLNFKASWGVSDWAVENYKTVNGDQQHELAYEAFYNEAILYKNASEEDAHAYAKSWTEAYVPKKTAMLTGKAQLLISMATHKTTNSRLKEEVKKLHSMLHWLTKRRRNGENF